MTRFMRRSNQGRRPLQGGRMGGYGHRDRSGQNIKQQKLIRFLLKGKKDDLFLCKVCNYDAVSSEGFYTHTRVNNSRHNEMVKKDEQKIKTKLEKYFSEAHKNASEAEKEGKPLDFCLECLLQYTGTEDDHINSEAHKEIKLIRNVYCELCFEYSLYSNLYVEQHDYTARHIRNRSYEKYQDGTINPRRLLQCPKNYTRDEEVGSYFVNDNMYYYCTCCDKHFEPEVDGKDTFKDHCSSKEHYDKYKEYCEKMKALKEAREKRAKEREERQKEEEEKKAKEAEARKAKREEAAKKRQTKEVKKEDKKEEKTEDAAVEPEEEKTEDTTMEAEEEKEEAKPTPKTSPVKASPAKTPKPAATSTPKTASPTKATATTPATKSPKPAAKPGIKAAAKPGVKKTPKPGVKAKPKAATPKESPKAATPKESPKAKQPQPASKEEEAAEESEEPQAKRPRRVSSRVPK